MRVFGYIVAAIFVIVISPYVAAFCNGAIMGITGDSNEPCEHIGPDAPQADQGIDLETYLEWCM